MASFISSDQSVTFSTMLFELFFNRRGHCIVVVQNKVIDLTFEDSRIYSNLLSLFEYGPNYKD